MGPGWDTAAASPPARPPARRPGRALTRLWGKCQAALRVQPVEAAVAWRGGGLIRPVQVAVIPEAAYGEEEPPRQDTEWPAGSPGPPLLGDLALTWKTPPASLGCCEAGKRREGGRVKSPSRCPAPSAQCWLFSFLF